MNARARLARHWAVGLGLALAQMALPVSAATVDAARIAAQGNGRGLAPCQSCHGADGGGQAAAGFPRLAGLDARYLERQLDAFAGGTRDNPVMRPVASALSPQERQALAAFYSRLPVPKAAPQPTPPATANALGRQLAVGGRWSANIPPCERCHGPAGVGVGSGFPPLAGQSQVYLANQLRAWRAGTRRNDPLQLMQGISKALDDNDIQAVTAWFAAQSPGHEEGNR